MGKWIVDNKRFAVLFAILFILSVGFLIFVYNDSFLYKTTIVKITETVNSKTDTGQEDYSQAITAVILNGEYKGCEIDLENTYTYSGVRDEKYSKSDRLFISLKEDEDGSLSGEILYMKRDFYVAVMAVVLLLLLILTAGLKGFFTIISVTGNIVIFYTALEMYNDGIDILDVAIIMIVVFTVFTMLVVNGLNWRALAAVLSVIASVTAIWVIYCIAANIGEQPEYIMMEYIVRADDIDKLFMAEVMIGGLGAVMDVAVSMASLVEELIYKDKGISEGKLVKSVRELGYDIMGTMINVMFFTFLSGSIPLTVIQIKNSYKFMTILKLYLPFEIIRFLVGAIGIVISIPIAGVVSIVLMRRLAVKD